MTNVNLPPDVEAYAPEHLRKALDTFLEPLENDPGAKRAFEAMLEEVEAEADRDGCVTMEAMREELEGVIEEAAKRRA